MTGNVRRPSTVLVPCPASRPRWCQLVIALVCATTVHAQEFRLVGRVVDATTAAPVRGALITTTTGVLARTDADGTFETAQLSGPIAMLRITKPGYVAVELTQMAARAGRIEVGMQRGAVLVAFVLDDQGQPLPQATVTVSCSGRSGSGSGRTDERGEARISGLPPGRCSVTGEGRPLTLTVGSTSAPPRLDPAALRDRAERQRGARGAAIDVDLRAGEETGVVVMTSAGPPGGIDLLELPGASAGTAVIAGRVLDGAGQPLRHVPVRAHGAGQAQMGLSDGDGRYRIERLPPGQFIVGVLAPASPLAPAEERPSVVTLKAGEIRNDVDFRMVLQTTISGTVVDQFGEPIQGARVRVERMDAVFPLPLIAGIPSVPTDDRGRYRALVMPGAYRVSAVVSDGPREEEFFFPGTPDLRAAGRVDARPQTETAGIDIATHPLATALLTGSVVDAAGRPAVRGVATLVSATGGATLPARLRSEVQLRDGQFEFPNVREGEYHVLVSTAPGPFVIMTHRDGRPLDAPAIPSNEFGRVMVRVGDRPASAVVRTAPPSVIRGRVVFEGDPAGLSPSSIFVAPHTVGSPLGYPAVALASDWSFELPNLTMESRLELQGTLRDWWVKSFLVNGVNAADEPVNFAGGVASSDDVQVLVARMSRVTGSVTGDTAAVRRIVVAFPVERERRYPRSRFVRWTNVLNGAYTLNLPPGQYWLVALTDLERPSPNESEMLLLESSAVLIAVTAERESRHDLRFVQLPK